jgi:hypothetical protein
LQPCGHGLGLMAEDVSGVSEVSVFPIRHLCLLFVGMRAWEVFADSAGGRAQCCARPIHAPNTAGLEMRNRARAQTARPQVGISQHNRL